MMFYSHSRFEARGAQHLLVMGEAPTRCNVLAKALDLSFYSARVGPLLTSPQAASALIDARYSAFILICGPALTSLPQRVMAALTGAKPRLVLIGGHPGLARAIGADQKLPPQPDLQSVLDGLDTLLLGGAP